MNFDERDLYTGLAALHWSAISDTDSRWDQAFYKMLTLTTPKQWFLLLLRILRLD